MEQTLHDLGGIVLQALPTFFLVLLLTVLVRALYFKPLDKVLAERSRLTEGARKAAEASLKSADEKISEYENSLNKARGEIYAEQAQFLQAIRAEQAAKVQAVRSETEKRTADARQALAAQTAEARASLEAQAELLSGQIADAVLRGRAV